MTAAVTFAAGDLEAELTGGAQLSVSALRHRGSGVLLAPGELPAKYRVHGQRAGITLLHPWGNRLGSDEYELHGVAARVPAGDPAVSRDPNGLAIHGLAPADLWRVEADGDAAAVARADVPAHPAFPVPHAAEVRCELGNGRLRVVLDVRPTGDVPLPLALGWHPYFTLPGVAREDWVLDLPPRRHLRLDDGGLPTGDATAEAPDRAVLGDRRFDDGYDEIADGAVFGLEGGGRRIAVVHDEGYPAAQVFAPADADVVSLEPMAAVTDALRTGRGLRSVAPGAVERLAFTVRVAVAV